MPSSKMRNQKFRAAEPLPRRAPPPLVAVPKRLSVQQPGHAVFVGAPSIWSNPFKRPGIGQARSVILYRAWLSHEATPAILRCAHFSEAEIIALERRLRAVTANLNDLRGKNVRCNCPPWEPWCHGDVLVRAANPDIGPLFPATVSSITADMVPY
ncbi:MAG: DUF4326 domain-containing protein [Sphingomonas oligoaromativorans]